MLNSVWVTMVETGGGKPRRFERLIPFRVHDVLLVSSPYDHYVLEEDGLLSDLMRKEYQELNFTQAPRITHANDADEALELMKRWNFQLVITMARVGRMGVEDFGKAVKEKNPTLPVVLLAHNTRELATMGSSKFIERVFVWSGDSRLLLAIVKLVEDERNVEHDIKIGNVQVLLMVEDSRTFYSTYLPRLYTELVTQTRRVMDEGLNLQDRILRTRARAKILHATNMEDAIAVVDRYGPNLLGLITDAGFPSQNRKSSRSGVMLIKRVRERFPYLPILMQSTELENKKFAEAHGATFYHKVNTSTVFNLENVMHNIFGFGDFTFSKSNGEEIGKASNLKELLELLKSVDIDSVMYHAEENQFSHWLRTRIEFDLAAKIRHKRAKDFLAHEEVRDFLVETIQEFILLERQKGVLEFSGIVDPQNRFQRIGDGSLGGKGRGLAFFYTQMPSLEMDDEFPDVELIVPRSLVLATGVFEEFIKNNNLRDFSFNSTDDDEILKTYIGGELSEEVVSHLRAALEVYKKPLAVRSSSRLEDALHQPFAGVYSTFFLPNDHPDLEIRLSQLTQAIKCVYASTYFQHAKAYIEATSNSIEEEQMAVVIQQLIGLQHGEFFYPTVAGVARSFNFYPVGPMSPEEGIAAVAMGLGKTVAEGERCLRFSPSHPKRIYQFADIESTLKTAQREFWALNMNKSEVLPLNPDYNLIKVGLDVAESHGQLASIGSTWDAANDRIWDGIGRDGGRLVTLYGMLKQKKFPLTDILKEVLGKCEAYLACPVEIEFAVLYDNKNNIRRFGMLQLRPLVSESADVAVDLPKYEQEEMFCSTETSLGNGILDDIYDIVYVHPDRLERSNSNFVAKDIAKINGKLVREKSPYLLIGPGRWGSSDHLLGIPVGWGQISGAKTIIECEMADISVDPSQGTHFFQNIVSFNVGYLTIRNNDPGKIDWAWLDSLESEKEIGPTRHIKLKVPLRILLDGRNGNAVILKPNGKKK